MNDWNSNIYDSVSEAHTASLLMLLCYIMWNRLVPGYLPACLGESKLETQFPGGDGCSGLFTKLVSQDLTSCSMPHLVSSKWEICVPTPILVWGRLPPSLCYWSLEPLCLECFSLAQSSLLADRLNWLSPGPIKNAMFTGKIELLFQYFLTSCNYMLWWFNIKFSYGFLFIFEGS